MMKWRIAVVVTLVLGGLAFGATGLRWELVRAQIAHKFPDVPSLSTEELARWLHDPKRPPPLLLDVRTAAEFQISHLHGARRVDPEAEPEQIKLPSKETSIVTYCSVGYRSAALAQRLRQAGYLKVWNLEGSIFEWANEGRELERDGQVAQLVHPYSEFWGALLKPALRAPMTKAR